MAPISSGSSTWTSAGIPFSFVSMATGIGPSSSGSQATVASVVTSTLLAGLGFGGGVISSFPSSVWPSRAPAHYPASTRHTAKTTEPTKDATNSASAVTAAAAKDNGEAGGEDRESTKGEGEDGEKGGEDKDKEEEEEEEKDEKKERKRRVGKVERKDNGTVANEPPSETPDSTAREKKQTEPDPSKAMPGMEDQLQGYTQKPPDSDLSTTTEAANDTAATFRPGTGRDRKNWPFSVHDGESAKASALC